MENALDKAIANASLNAKMNGDILHTENLDSIADPTSDNPQLLSDHQIDQLKQDLQPRNFASQFQQPLPRPVLNYQQMMEAEYWQKAKEVKQQGGIFDNIGLLEVKVSEMNASLINLHCKIDSLTYTIQAAAETMPQERSHKHRSLHEWDDTQLLNELVERENDLMPFYYELLKRIGSPELQKLVMSSMQGKNNSMVTLAQLCSALGSMAQPQSQPLQGQEFGLSRSAEQRMDEAFHAATTPQQYTQAQLDNLRFNGQSSGITVEEIAQYERMKQSTVIPKGISRWDNSFPQQQYFGQATEEYIRQTNNR